MDKNYKLTLCMIVKDESDNIKGTLENIVENFNIDYWVISDTGSKDDTIDIIKETFETLNIPGKFHNKDWKDFSTNRNYVIEEAEKVSNYLLFFDADDKIIGDFKLPELLHDAYLMRFGPDFVFHRIFIVNTKNKWRYRGILHEYIECDNPYFSQVSITGNYFVVPGTHGCRSKDPMKYLNDALVFEKAIISKETPKDLMGRYTYYCAQSYKDCLNMERAIEFYEKTLKYDTWVQEKYIACKMLGDYYKKRDVNKAIKYYVESRKYDPTRVECTLELSRLMSDKRLQFTILTSIPPTSVANPISDKYLFIDIPTHNVFYFNELMIIGYQLGEWEIVTDYLIEQLKRYKNMSRANLYSAFANIRICFERFNTKNLLTLFSLLNTILSTGHKEYPSKKDIINEGLNKIESIACSCNEIPYNIFKNANKNKKYSASIVFSFKNKDNFIKTFNSYINCFEDKEYINDYYIVCSEQLREELLESNPLFNFMNYRKNIFELKTRNNNIFFIDCNYYFCHKEKYCKAFINKLSEKKVDYIQFNKSSKNNYFSRILGHSGPLPCSIGENTSFDIMAPYTNKNKLVEIDFCNIKL